MNSNKKAYHWFYLDKQRSNLWNTPSFPTFDIKSGIFVNKNNSTTQSQIPSAVTPIIIQLPPQLYQQECISNNINTQSLASPNTLPSIGEFLNNLDQKYNSNIYSSFEEAFLDEEITVNAIKDLSDEQLQKLGVVKIGWQKNIMQAAQRFWYIFWIYK